MAASRKTTKNIDNAISSEQIPTKNFSTLLSKDDMENKNVSTDQCMSGINMSINNCISKLNNQNIEIKGLSKLNPMRIKKLPVRSRHALFYNVCTQKHVTDITTTGCHLRHRDREPSRIQVKWLTRKFGKSRLLRKRLRHNIKRSVPSGGARSRNLGGHFGGKLIFWGGKIEFLKRYCYTATGGRIS
jgi:hypothetical protein